MVKTSIYLLGIFILIPLSLLAEVQVKLQVQPSEASLEDDIEMVVTVAGSSNVEDPALPSIPAFKVIPQGASSSIQIINGNMSVRKSFSYALIPQERGDFLIPPVSVTIDGKSYYSESARIKITDNPSVAPNKHQGIPQFPQAETVPSDDSGRSSHNTLPYWIETAVDQPSPYLEQQILFRFKFFTSLNVGRATLTLPDFNGFSVEELVPEKKGYQTINGQRYVVSEKVIALFPLKTGTITIDAATLRVEVPDESASPFNDPFFFGLGRTQLKAKNLKSKSIEVNVKELPSNNQPANFTGLVGEFTAEYNISPQSVRVGDNINLEIVLKGRGNIKDAFLPKLDGLSGFKIYDDSPQMDLIRRETGLHGVKTFKKALVPLSGGEMSIPEIQISYFDPYKVSYETILLPSKNLRIEGQPASESLNITRDGKQAGDTEASDKGLRPLKNTLEVRGLEKPSIPYFLILPLIYLVSFLVIKKPFTNLFKIRRNSIHQLKRAMGQTGFSLKQEADHIQKALQIYFATRFHVAAISLTPKDMIDLLQNAGVARDLILRFEELVKELNSVIYDQTATTVLNKQDLLDLMSSIDKKIGAKNLTSLGLLCLFFISSHTVFATAEDDLRINTLKMYNKNNYTEALKLLDQWDEGFEKWYNMGTTFIKVGELGEARYYLEKAKDIQPRDNDLKANLSYLYALIGSPGTTNLAIDIVSSTELLWVACFLWNGIGLLMLFSLYSKRSPPKKIILFISVLLAITLALSYIGYVQKRQTGIIKDNNAGLFATFVDTEDPLITLKEGIKVRILSEQKLDAEHSRLQVEVDSNNKGWIDKKQVLIL